MGIVRTSDQPHEQARIACKAMGRFINAQAEHWMRIGMLIEANSHMSYVDAVKHLFEDVRNSGRNLSIDRTG